MKYIIVDDEHFAHDIIKGYCDQMPHLQFVRSCYDGIEAIQCLKQEAVDLIFLDLNMPKISGFDFLKTLPNQPKVIVTTAYKEFALEGYELNIQDYLLKPISFERFLKAINKLATQHNTTQIISSSGELKKEGSNQIFLRSNKNYYQVNLKDILFVESTGNYCKVVTINDEITIREKLSDILSSLPSDSFFQVHKSFIVSSNKINSVEGNRIFINKHEIPIGKYYKSNVNDLLNNNS